MRMGLALRVKLNVAQHHPLLLCCSHLLLLLLDVFCSLRGVFGTGLFSGTKCSAHSEGGGPPPFLPPHSPWYAVWRRKSGAASDSLQSVFV